MPFLPSVRVLVDVADPALGDQLVALLHGAEEITVLDPGTDGAEAQAARDQPDVVLLGLDSGDPAARCSAILAASPTTRVLTVAADATVDRRVADLVAAGARGCWDASAPVTDLVRVVRELRRGGALPDAVWAAWLAVEPADDLVVPQHPLSPTETEVLTRLADGMTVDALAELHQVNAHDVCAQAGFALSRRWRAVDEHAQLAPLLG